MCSHEQLGGLGEKVGGRCMCGGEESCASPNCLLCLELVEFPEPIPLVHRENMGDEQVGHLNTRVVTTLGSISTIDICTVHFTDHHKGFESNITVVSLHL